MLYRAILISFLVSAFLAYLLVPLFERLVLLCRGKRGVASFVLTFGILAGLMSIIASLIPLFYQQMIEITRRLPIAFQYLVSVSDPIRNFLIESGVMRASAVDSLVNDINLLSNVGDHLRGILEKMWVSTPIVLGGVINVALIPIIFFFFLKDLPKIKEGFRSIIPDDLVHSFVDFNKRMDNTLKSVLKGQVIVALTLGVLYMIGLSMIGLEFGLAIGAVAGLCRIVPYLDVIVGVSLSLIVVMTKYTSFAQVIGIAVIFGVVQLIDGMMITPRVIGQRTGLNPVVIILTIIAFGDWFGFLGILLAVPILAVITAGIETIIPVYLKSPFFQGKGAPLEEERNI
jgi:predicted PurR-regulated permease PerM